MEPKPFLNRHARRAALVIARRRPPPRFVAVVDPDHGARLEPVEPGARGPCGVRRYSVSNVVRALEASGQKARPR